MNKKCLVVKLGLLTAFAGPVGDTVIPTAAADGLQPASGVRPLRQVPREDSQIRQVQHQDQSRSLIPKLVLSQTSDSDASGKSGQASANPQPVQPRRYVQKQNAAQPQTAATNDNSRRRQRREPRQPGLLKRFWNRVTASDEPTADGQRSAQNQASAGQPAPPISRPPALTYHGQGSTGNTGRGVPARAASFSADEQGVPPVPGAGAAVQSNARTTLSGQLDPAAAAGDRKSTSQPLTAENDQFVSPFAANSAAGGEDELLDLDALVEEHAEAAADSAVVRKEGSTDTNVTPDPADDKGEIQNEAAVAASDVDGPFSGAPVDLAADAADIDQETSAEATAEPVISDAGGPDELEPSRVPGLDEPAMQLPPAADEAATAEQWVAAGDHEEEQAATTDTPDDDVLAATDASDETAEPLLGATPETEEAATAAIDEQKDPFTQASVTVETAAAVEEPKSNSDLAETPDPALNILDDRARREQQRYRIMSRAGQTGFKGFCPVELRDNRELIDSRQTYEARFGLQTYRFSSAAAKTAFEANPARYAPAAGGSDVVLLVNTGEELEGSLDFCLWYRDRLYMFRSRETQAIFSADPQKFASQY